MTKARDLADIISGGFDATDIPNLDTAKITSGTFVDARLPATALNSNVDLTTLSASNLTSGTVPTARLGSGTASSSTFLRGDNTFASAQGAYESQLLHVRDEKSANTAGGAFTSGDWRTRTLNTVMTNEISGASLSSNQVTLPSGTYYVHAGARGYTVNANKLRWYNTSDSSTVLFGDQARSDSSANANAFVSVMGRFTISAQKTFELQHRCETTRSDVNGFGIPANMGVLEVYANVQLWKVA